MEMIFRGTAEDITKVLCTMDSSEEHLKELLHWIRIDSEPTTGNCSSEN
jgi:hypothetical protein